MFGCFYIQQYFSKITEVMNENKSTEERLSAVLAKESQKFTKKKGELSKFFEEFQKSRNQTTSSGYNLPLKDTIGRALWEQTQKKSV